MDTMLAARMYGKQDIRLEQVAIPEINDNEILLKVKSAAICGTDIRMYMNGYKDISEDNPRIIGHEFAGVIEKVGKNVTSYKEGMIVAVAPNMGCGVCEFCTSGKGHLCQEFFQAPGINIDGAFAEYVKIPEPAVRQGNVIPLDERVSTEEAALNEPLSCVYNAFQKVGIFPGDNVLIIGAGPIGIMHAKLAKMAGAANIMINDLSKERIEICQKVDNSFIGIHSNNLEEAVMNITKEKGLDVCITANPAPVTQQIALKLMAMEGRVNFFGGLPKDKEKVILNTNTIHYKELVVTGSTKASVAMFNKTLQFIAEGLVDVKSLISNRYELKDIQEAIKSSRNATGLKNVIIFN
ncbi:MAG: alcohol dehydrogenase catalytic domain-containing protein [Vallitalea sp.]|nr:alcohol dehydrogenase catalytic domain-containing protein [Vallitalea sp.]